MAKFLIAAVLLGGLMSSTFTVEKLSTEEIDDLHVAREKYDAALSGLEATEKRIKEAHGQTKPALWSTAACVQGSTTVELRGEYALKTTETYNVCAGPQ